ncbi:MAG: putative nucleotidyltransferase [Parcubacteria group bacterium Licking1014_1]|nr:MAG: putative nucleotidyltransferase [Parcubacteria group bacterium Licking1014_1]
MNNNFIKKIIPIFETYPEIKLVYLFGSRAKGKIGPLSDYDFAVYLDEKDHIKRFDIRLDLMGKISSKLKTDAVDLCVLNDIEGPELKYNIIKDGVLILEREPFKVLIEPKIMTEYIDFHESLLRYNLTKA